MNTERLHFDREAAVYPEGVGTAFVQHLKWQLIRDRATAGSIAADIGAASGLHAIPLARLGATVVAVDLSPEMLARTKRRAETSGAAGHIHPVVAALPDLPLAANRFDLVYCYATLLLLPQPAQEESIRRMAAMLRPGGTLILDMAGRRSLAFRYWCRYYRRRGFSGLYGWTLGEVRNLIAESGLELQDIHPHGVLSQFLLLPGMQRLPGLERLLRGHDSRPGLDAWMSRLLPAWAERWYVVARRPRDPASG